MNKTKEWHSANQKPEKECWIIENRRYFYHPNGLQAFKYDFNVNWENHVKQDQIIEWIYQDEWMEDANEYLKTMDKTRNG